MRSVYSWLDSIRIKISFLIEVYLKPTGTIPEERQTLKSEKRAWIGWCGEHFSFVRVEEDSV